MPIERHPISRSQLCELLGVDPALFVAVEREQAKREDQRQGLANLGWVIVTEAHMNTSGTFPQLNTGKKPKGKGKGKRGC